MTSMVILLAGCVPLSPLDEVPLLGETPEQREAVLSELAWFDHRVGPGRLGLRAISFEVVPEGLGLYGPEGEIWLEPSLQPHEVGPVLRHELCHALDAQESLSRTHAAALLTLQELTSPTGADSPSREAREIFASLCELGPEAARVLAEPCPGEPQLLSPVMAWMAEELWVEGERFGPGEEVPFPSRSRRTYAPERWLVAEGGLDREGEPAVQVLTWGDNLEWHAFALWTEDYAGGFVPDPVDHMPVEEVGEGVTLHRQAGWYDGPAGGIASVELPDLGTYWRVVSSGGDGWRRVPGGCHAGWTSGAVFAAGGQIWYIHVGGTWLRWRPITP